MAPAFSLKDDCHHEDGKGGLDLDPRCVVEALGKDDDWHHVSSHEWGAEDVALAVGVFAVVLVGLVGLVIGKENVTGVISRDSMLTLLQPAVATAGDRWPGPPTASPTSGQPRWPG